MPPPDQYVEVLSRLSVSFIGFVDERSLGHFGMSVEHTPGRLHRESSRSLLPLVLFAGQCHERFAQRYAELLKYRQEQFEVDRLERSV
jgi:hypothetical protein